MHPVLNRARANAKTPRDLEGSDAIVQKTLDLIRFYGCPFALEIPWTGLLRTRDVVRGIPYVVADYCKYGSAFRKRTAFWHNIGWTPSQPLCKHDCPASDGKRHRESAQQGPKARGGGVRHTVNQLHAIPHPLCQDCLLYTSPSPRD